MNTLCPLPYRRFAWSALAFLLLAGAGPASAAGFGIEKVADRIELAAEVKPGDPFSDMNKPGAKLEVKPGETVHLVVKGTPKGDFHTYPVARRTAVQPTVTDFVVEKSDSYQALWPIAESDPQLYKEKQEGGGTYWVHGKPFSWAQDVYITPAAKAGVLHLHVKIKVTACDEHTCLLPETVPFDLPITVVEGPAVSLTPDLEARLKAPRPEPVLTDAKGKVIQQVAAPPGPPPEVKPPDAPKRDDEKVAIITPPAPSGGQPTRSGTGADGGLLGLLLFMGQGAMWGFISLLTPCVFPMIPITVSFFLKQSERRAAVAGAVLPAVVKKTYSPLLLALVYCGTIIVVLTISTVGLLSVFTLISTYWLTNFLLGALFIFFALSLFGMYDIELPRGLAAFTSKNEGKGGLVGTMFMALTFTIISFACVAPFLGGFGGTAAAGGGLPWSHRIAGGLAFATAFASPFFFLALFPTLLKTLPKSGTWLNSVKVVMGFLELAAAVKFLRAGELLVSALYHATPTFFTYDLCLGMYVALAFACGLYLLNVYRLPHDTPINNLGVPRLLLSIAFLSLGLYLMPALFKLNAQGDSQRPGGVVFAWLDSFLLPELSGNGPGVASGRDDKAGGNAELAWREDLQAGLKEANAKHGLVFVDFSGINCPNCRLNERGVFPRPEVKDAMSRYTLVRLITDYDANKELEAKRFDTISLPHYVILRPKMDKEGNATGDFETVSEYPEGAINNVAGFVKFLKDPLGTQTADARTAGE